LLLLLVCARILLLLLLLLRARILLLLLLLLRARILLLLLHHLIMACSIAANRRAADQQSRPITATRCCSSTRATARKAAAGVDCTMPHRAVCKAAALRWRGAAAAAPVGPGFVSRA
jgi:hypothetical protein